MYGANASFVLLFMVISSFLAHHAARPKPGIKRTTSQDVQGVLALFFRWAGKGLGLLNCGVILIASVMQFSGIYDNCYCSSSLARDYAFLHLMDAGVIRGSTVYQFWIGGLSHGVTIVTICVTCLLLPRSCIRVRFILPHRSYEDFDFSPIQPLPISTCSRLQGSSSSA
jgi:hypothetical protein